MATPDDPEVTSQHTPSFSPSLTLVSPPPPTPLPLASSPPALDARAKGAILLPLVFPGAPEQDLSRFIDPSLDVPLLCLVCEESFDGGEAKEKLLKHLFTAHKIVVHATQNICSLQCYTRYWRSRLKQASITDFMAVIRTNSTSDEFASEEFFLLSDELPEDKQLREHLKMKRLEAVLAVQQCERTDTAFSRMCLFCSHVATGNRTALFQHMLEAHGFNVGLPDNLVFVKEFLDLLQEKLDSLQCLYCEKTFRDRATLKEHMRKKQHKRLNPQNKTFDRFYPINYLEAGRGWEELQREGDGEIPSPDDNNEWGEWEEAQQPVFCLFCPTGSASQRTALEHMKLAHDFDFRSVCVKLQLDYYAQVKAVNFIRRQVHTLRCVHCSQRCASREQLLEHMQRECHFALPADQAQWRQPQHLFPTYENDSFLYALEDDFAPDPGAG